MEVGWGSGAASSIPNDRYRAVTNCISLYGAMKARIFVAQNALETSSSCAHLPFFFVSNVFSVIFFCEGGHPNESVNRIHLESRLLSPPSLQKPESELGN